MSHPLYAAIAVAPVKPSRTTKKYKSDSRQTNSLSIWVFRVLHTGNVLHVSLTAGPATRPVFLGSNFCVPEKFKAALIPTAIRIARYTARQMPSYYWNIVIVVEQLQEALRLQVYLGFALHIVVQFCIKILSGCAETPRISAVLAILYNSKCSAREANIVTVSTIYTPLCRL